MEFSYLNDKDLLFFSKHILLPSIGIEGQQRLNAAEVSIFGLGGLGNLLSTYIASSGIRKINIIDFDIVEETNLQRQINFSTGDIGLSKADVIETYLINKFSSLNIKKYKKKIESSDEVKTIISNSDVVLDGTDNFLVRKIINRACVENNKKLIVGAVEGYTAQLMTMISSESPCYECIYEDLIDSTSCSDAGVLAPLVGMISSMMALECINILTGNNSSFDKKLLVINGLNFSVDSISTKKNQKCKVCNN